MAQVPKSIDGPFGITVTGFGSAELDPDFVEISFAVHRADAQALQAYRAALQADGAIAEILRQHDVPDSHLRIEPVVLHHKPEDPGGASHRARRVYRVWLSRPDRVDAVLDQ